MGQWMRHWMGQWHNESPTRSLSVVFQLTYTPPVPPKNRPQTKFEAFHTSSAPPCGILEILLQIQWRLPFLLESIMRSEFHLSLRINTQAPSNRQRITHKYSFYDVIEHKCTGQRYHEKSAQLIVGEPLTRSGQATWGTSVCSHCLLTISMAPCTSSCTL